MEFKSAVLLELTGPILVWEILLVYNVQRYFYWELQQSSRFDWFKKLFVGLHFVKSKG